VRSATPIAKGMVRTHPQPEGGQVEMLWNRLANIHDFSLLCGYSMGNFYKDAMIENVTIPASAAIPDSTTVPDSCFRIPDSYFPSPSSRCAA
jgi:hypothetical protein